MKIWETYTIEDIIEFTLKLEILLVIIGFIAFTLYGSIVAFKILLQFLF